MKYPIFNFPVLKAFVQTNVCEVFNKAKADKMLFQEFPNSLDTRLEFGT